MDFLQFLADVFFPCSCVSCGKGLAREVICRHCFESIPVNGSFFCATCKARLPSGKKICHTGTPYILGAAGLYAHPTVKILIHDLKFRGVRAAADPLAGLLARYFMRCRMDLTNSVIIPIPLSKRRECERGFNQAGELARRTGEKIGLPFDARLLARTRDTLPQTETAGAAERRLNVAGCFFVPVPTAVARRNIILIDDVTTSGATLGEAARTLKKAGARTILAVAAAMA